jgi:hypothetical protein
LIVLSGATDVKPAFNRLKCRNGDTLRSVGTAKTAPNTKSQNEEADKACASLGAYAQMGPEGVPKEEIKLLTDLCSMNPDKNFCLGISAVLDGQKTKFTKLACKGK